MLVELITGPAVLTVVKILKETLHLPLRDVYNLIYDEKGHKSEIRFECPDEKFEELKSKILMYKGHLYKVV